MIKLKIPDSDLRLKEENRQKLKETLGPVVSGALPSEYTDRNCIIAVGDVVTDILLDQGITPDVSIVDDRTRRGDYDIRERPQEKTLNIKNPAGIITKEAWKTVQQALDNEEPVLIQVDGEEDLLSLVSIALSPEGCLVIYGIPDEGMVINDVNRGIKEKTWEVINNMIKIKGG